MAKQRENHGLSNHPLYKKWQDMKDRCYNPNSQRFPWYGAKGITVCQEWLESPAAFISWCQNQGWQPGMEIDKDLKVPGCTVYSPTTCSVVSHRQNMLPVVGRESGRKTQKLKLSVTEVENILQRKSAGEKTRLLAEEFDVSVTLINTLYREHQRA